MADKKSIRKSMLKQRKSLTEEEQKEAGQKALNIFIQDPIVRQAQTFHLYYPIHGELSTLSILDWLWNNNKTVVMPRTDFEARKMLHHIVCGYKELEETTFTMHEPEPHTPLWQGKLDIIIVPGVAFDCSMNRLGYGGGFYDQFLATTEAVKVAFAYEFQILPNLPVEAHDQKVDCILTPERFLTNKE